MHQKMFAVCNRCARGLTRWLLQAGVGDVAFMIRHGNLQDGALGVAGCRRLYGTVKAIGIPAGVFSHQVLRYKIQCRKLSLRLHSQHFGDLTSAQVGLVLQRINFLLVIAQQIDPVEPQTRYQQCQCNHAMAASGSGGVRRMPYGLPEMNHA